MNSDYEKSKNPWTSPEELERIAFSDYPWNYKYDVANNPNCPINVLEHLSEHVYYKVRIVVAENPKTPLHILEKLVTDQEDWRIGYFVSKNPNCPKKLKDLNNALFFINDKYQLEKKLYGI
jgi:hypothetical protein